MEEVDLLDVDIQIDQKAQDNNNFTSIVSENLDVQGETLDDSRELDIEDTVEQIDVNDTGELNFNSEDLVEDYQENKSAPKAEMVPIEAEELIQENDGEGLDEEEDEDVQVGAVENEEDIVSEPMANQDDDADQIKEVSRASTRSASLPVVITDSIKAIQAEEEKKQEKSLLTSIFKKKDDGKKYTIEHILDAQSTEGFFHDNEETKKILMSFLSKGDQWLYELWLNQKEVNFRLIISYLAMAIIHNKYRWLAPELKMILQKTNLWIKHE